MENHLQGIVTLLALINPAMCAAIFTKAVGTESRQIKIKMATQASFTVLVILIIAAMFGAKILNMFGVSLDAFSVAGGGVLAWIGLSMLKGDAADHSDSSPDTEESVPSITPLILFAASPGTITGVITLAVSHSRLNIPVAALVAVSVATVLMHLVLLLTIYLASHEKQGNEKVKSKSFVRDTITRFMGLIVVAMGIQFALTGIRSFMIQ